MGGPGVFNKHGALLYTLPYIPLVLGEEIKVGNLQTRFVAGGYCYRVIIHADI